MVIYTFGNASDIDRGATLIAIKPSGVPELGRPRSVPACEGVKVCALLGDRR